MAIALGLGFMVVIASTTRAADKVIVLAIAHRHSHKSWQNISMVD
jgi:hypothetical protein